MKQKYFILLAMMSLLSLAQISEIEDINSSGDSSPDNFFVDSQNRLFFEAENGVDGKELYIYDNSSVTLIDINNATTDLSSFPERFIEFENKIYFRANNEIFSAELWVTDGTNSGTSLVADINPGDASGNPNHFFTFNDELYFVPLDGTSTQYWALNDGTPIKITNNNGGAFSSASYPQVNSSGAFIRLNNGNGYELGFFDGTGDATEILDIRAGSLGGMLVSTDQENITLLGEKLLFEADSDGTNDEIWVSDGTATGTFMLADTNPDGNGDPDYFQVHQGEMFFASKDANGYQLWKTNATVAGTTLVADINSSGDGEITDLYSAGTNLYFSGTNGTDGVELWVYNGTTTIMVKDINVAGDSSPEGFISLGDKVYFSADDGTGVKLWITDGTEEGTAPVSSLFTTTEDPIDIDNITVMDDKLVFSATGANGEELFVYQPYSSSLSLDSFETSFSIYPNPSKNYLNIQINLEGDFNYTICNILGKQILSGVVMNSVIDHKLTTGVYILKLANGSNSITRKIIVKN